MPRCESQSRRASVASKNVNTRFGIRFSTRRTKLSGVVAQWPNFPKPFAKTLSHGPRLQSTLWPPKLFKNELWLNKPFTTLWTPAQKHFVSLLKADSGEDLAPSQFWNRTLKTVCTVSESSNHVRERSESSQKTCLRFWEQQNPVDSSNNKVNFEFLKFWLTIFFKFGCRVTLWNKNWHG